MRKSCRMTLALVLFAAVPVVAAPEPSLASKFVGRWVNANDAKGGGVMSINSVDSSTGELRGKYVPPSGPAGGKEFDVVGFVSSAPPVPNRDNVVTVSFSVSLKTYGSIATWTGYIKDDRMIVMWLNVRPNSAYDWDHIVTGQDTWVRKTQ